MKHSTNNFAEDDAWQKQMRDSILVPQLYQKIPGWNYVLLDSGRLADTLQRQGVDTIIRTEGGASKMIEEKIVRWPESNRPHERYALETWSCSNKGRWSPGWMAHYSIADYLIYCFAQKNGGLICHLIDFQELKKWFWEWVPPEWKPRFLGCPVHTMPTKNRGITRLVPINAVRKNVKVKIYGLEAP